MSDQATNLRQLIHKVGPSSRDVPVTGAPMIGVTGGRSGVGTTTTAVNLASGLADRGLRVLLVDAAEERPQVAEIADIRSRVEFSLADVLAGKSSAADAIVPGPSGTMVLTERGRVPRKKEFEGRKESGTTPGSGSSRLAQQVLHQELQLLEDRFDLMVVDMGSGLTPWTRRFWLQSQLVLVVSTADSTALIESYATVKRSVADSLGPDTRLLVNQCDDERLADDAQVRFANACQRFLGRTVPSLPSLPRHEIFDDASEVIHPRIWENPDTPYGHSVLWLARVVADLFDRTTAGTAAVPFANAA